MSTSTLAVLLGGRALGRVERDRRGQLRFIYDETWRASPNALPLSLSMPLAAGEHEHEPIDAFLRGLLPDNTDILRQWGQRFGVSPHNPFALLSHVGEDCAGAVQFVRDERLEAVASTAPWEVDWLDEAGVEERLLALKQDPSAWRAPRDAGQFSLAGAQPKTALLWWDGQWGIPAGQTPTTHILKPPLAEYDGHVENEHFCLSMARALSLSAATSVVQRFGSVMAIVVERYDRVSTARLAEAAAAEAAEAATDPDAIRGAQRASEAATRARVFGELVHTQPILRLHQEDLCQALGRAPSSKYQNEGGPSPAEVVSLLRGQSTRPVLDVRTFVDALAFNWLVAGTDAHAKNYSVLHGGGGRVRLAPLYDVASALPYDNLDPRRITLAMKVGSKYRVRDVTFHQWRKLATNLSLDPDETISRVTAMAARCPDTSAAIRDAAKEAGLGHPILSRLADRVARHSEWCLSRLRRG